MRLKYYGFMSRQTIVLDQGVVMVLEHEFTADRVRRIHPDQVESVVVWKTIDWWRLVIFSAITLLPGIGMVLGSLSDAGSSTQIIGLVLLVIGLILALRLVIYGRTMFRVRRAGKIQTFRAVAGPKKIRQFVSQWVEAIELHQAAAQAAAPTPATTNAKEPQMNADQHG